MTTIFYSVGKTFFTDYKEATKCSNTTNLPIKRYYKEDYYPYSHTPELEAWKKEHAKKIAKHYGDHKFWKEVDERIKKYYPQYKG